MTTARQSTGAWAWAAALAVALGGCGGGAADGRRADPVRPPAVAAPAGPAGPDLRTPQLQPLEAPCAAGPGFSCSLLRVDLDRAAATGSRLNLTVAVADGPRPPRGYLVALAGGPGQAGVPLAQLVRRGLGSVAPGYGLVVLDQRGTGAGAPDCAGLQRSVGSSDVAVAPRGTVEACARRIGPQLADFTTADTVGDLEDLRLALGAERLTLAGVSYGTFVAERYALAYPDHVRALVLDSVVPQEGADVLLRSSMQAVPRVLRAVCRATRCPGDVAADLRAALAFGADDVALLDTLVARSLGRPRLEAVPPALREAARGRLTALRALGDRARDEAATADPATYSTGLHAATLCAESDVPWQTAEAVPADREQALAQARAQLTPSRLGGFEPATAVENGFADTCRRWPPLADPPAAPTGPLPDVPTLLLAGELDLATPVEDAREQLARSPGGRLLVVPGAGHSLISSDQSGCVRGAVRLLLAGRRPPARCR